MPRAWQSSYFRMRTIGVSDTPAPGRATPRGTTRRTVLRRWAPADPVAGAAFQPLGRTGQYTIILGLEKARTAKGCTARPDKAMAELRKGAEGQQMS